MKQNRNQIKSNNVYNSHYSRLQQLNYGGGGAGVGGCSPWRSGASQRLVKRKQEEMEEMTNKPASLRLSFQPARTDIGENAAHK